MVLSAEYTHLIASSNALRQPIAAMAGGEGYRQDFFANSYPAW